MTVLHKKMSTDNEDKTDDLSKASTAIVDDEVNTKTVGFKDEEEHVHTTEEHERKPYLGGYKHKLTGVTYYHATTQTIRPPWDSNTSEKFSRDAQCVEKRNQAQQTARDASTQVQVRNIFIQTSSDQFVESSDKYVYADEIQAEFLTKILIMQKFVRRWLAQKELKRRRQSLFERLSWEEEQQKTRKKQDSSWLKDLQKRKLYPIKEDDFILLFSDLQNWWEHEAKTISETKPESFQQEAMWHLVNTEVKKIAEINNTKSMVENRRVFNQRQRLLIEAGKPKLWKAYKKDNRELIPVITESTQKGHNLQDLYTTLSMKYISTQERIDALQSLIQLLQKYNCNLTNTLLQLAQREVDLLLRGTKVRNLEGLRSRIQDLFWQYVRQPMFNPRMQGLPSLKKVSGSDPHVLCCAGCKQFYILPLDSVNEVVGKSVLGNCFTKCKKCHYLENEGWIRKDTELYKKILRMLIEEEGRKSSGSSMLYILQPIDIKHLVEAIWKRQSCLSGARDESELELVRYNVDEDWTPWNCMLVTRDEAAIMSRIPNPKTTYDSDFKKFVYQRHIAARSYFATIPRFLPYVTKSAVEDYRNSSENENV